MFPDNEPELNVLTRRIDKHTSTNEKHYTRVVGGDKNNGEKTLQ